MTVNRRFLYWGVFLLAAGGVMLAARGDAIDDETIAAALGLWPVVLVALGIGLLLRRTRLGLAGGLVAAALPGLLLGGMVVAAPRLLPPCDDVRPASLTTREGTFAGAASVDLRLACGELSVTTVPGSGWRLEAGAGPRAAATVDASAGGLAVASAEGDRRFGLPRGHDVWRLALPTASPLDLAAEVNAGRGRFDLAGARLGSVRVDVRAGEASLDLSAATVERLALRVDAGSASLRLPSASDVGADLAVNAGSLSICAPADLGLRIQPAVVLGSTTFTGLVRVGDAWESPGYATAIHHADVTVAVNVGSVDVNPLGGCQ